jgi:hypothetical protein
MTTMTINEKNAHQRDALIQFEEGPHKYTCNGESDYTSVTTWLHSHFKQFDADAIIAKMMSNPERWKKSPYYGKTPEEIKAGWDKNRDEAAAAGTEMHQCIENFYLGVNSTDLSPHFIDFVKDHPDLIPYRTEWMIFDEDVRLAGSIDMVGLGGTPPAPQALQPPSDDNTQTADRSNFTSSGGVGACPQGGETPQPIVLYDWKRCKEIKDTNSFGEFALTDCIKHIPDTNFWHYALQLNTYKTILERKYNKTVAKMFLVCLHPNLPSYQLLEVPDLADEMKALFAMRDNNNNTN